MAVCFDRKANGRVAHGHLSNPPVCDYGSFTAAAKALHVSQPSVTMGVARLEKSLGGALLERRHPVRMTPLGLALLPHLEAIKSAADNLEHALTRRQSDPLPQDVPELTEAVRMHPRDRARRTIRLRASRSS